MAHQQLLRRRRVRCSYGRPSIEIHHRARSAHYADTACNASLGSTANEVNVQFGPGFSREKQTNVANMPAATASGQLGRGESVRVVTRNAPDPTNSREIPRDAIDASVYADRYGRT